MAFFVFSRSAGFHSAFAGRGVGLQSLSSLIGGTTCSLLRNFSQKMSLPRVFFDMTADGAPVGRIIMEVSTIFDISNRILMLDLFPMLFASHEI